ncbi:MAG: NAD(P)H-dependent oxidoreductase [Rhodospirillales bacterium]|nr:NAD(P)H-dependent oxidoreductase [Rhodospirillales bacterium]
MAQLLRIDSSSRLHDSHTREIADSFEHKWLRKNPDDKIVRRDLVRTKIPHIEAATIAAFYAPPDQHTQTMKAATVLSDALIAELMAADAILISAPMYNFSIPSALKAYIDHVVRINRTFGFDEKKGFSGLLKGKPVTVITAYGAAGYFGGDFAPMNFLTPYLKALLGFLGFTDMTFIFVEGTTLDPSALAASRRQADADIERAVSQGLRPGRTGQAAQ